MEKAIRHITDLLLFSNAWVAVCVGGLITGFGKLYGIEDLHLYGSFAFLGTYATYNFHRLVRNDSLRKAAVSTDRTRWLDSVRRSIIITTGMAALAAAIIFFLLPFRSTAVFLLAGTGIIVLFYAVRIPGTRLSLRDLAGTKNLWIVLVWTVMLLLPLLNRGKVIYISDVILAASFIYVQIIPFDIRDFHYDNPGMYTFPQLFGITGARIAATLLILTIAAGLLFTHGFHSTLIPCIATAFCGLWWPQTQGNLRYLELSWDGTLLLLGAYYYTVTG